MLNLQRKSEGAPRWAAALAGASLLVMAVLAPVALARWSAALDAPFAEGTAAAVLHDAAGLRTAAAGLFVTALLDLGAAAGLYALFARAHRTLALLVALSRTAYTACFVLAVADLLVAVDTAGQDLPAGTLRAGVGQALAGFGHGWALALGLFGLHLCLVAGAVAVAGPVPRLLAPLTALSGLGYLVDALGEALLAHPPLTVGQVTFVGEAALMLWLCWAAVSPGALRAGTGAGPAGPAPA